MAFTEEDRARLREEVARKKYNKDTTDLTLLGQKETVYPQSPEEAVLETFPNPCPDRDYQITLECPEFTSLCPKTGQPDFGQFIIQYCPNQKCLESKALKLYLFSFRNQGAFWERLVTRILKDLVQAVEPKSMLVRGTMNPRGGIALTVEAVHPEEVE